jgi:hypothetical protein
VQVSRDGTDRDGFVSGLRPGDQVRVQTWRDEIVALRDEQGRVMSTNAGPFFSTWNWVLGAIFGIFVLGVGALGLLEQTLQHLRSLRMRTAIRAGEGLPHVARSKSARLVVAFTLLATSVFPAANVVYALLVGGEVTPERLAPMLTFLILVGGPGALLGLAGLRESLRIEMDHFVYRSWRRTAEVCYSDIERLEVEPSAQRTRVLVVHRRTEAAAVLLSDRVFAECDLALLVDAIARFSPGTILDVGAQRMRTALADEHSDSHAHSAGSVAMS